jgi:hypothetical protein
MTDFNQSVATPHEETLTLGGDLVGSGMGVSYVLAGTTIAQLPLPVTNDRNADSLIKGP